MPSRKKEQKINLLPREEFLASTAGRVLSWILSTFRVIVIITEILVMLAFLSRFWFDAQNTDLGELMKQKESVLAASLGFEKEFRDVQSRLKVFSEYSQEEGIVAETLNTATSYLPPDVALTSYSYAKEAFVIMGTSPSEISIQQFVVNLAKGAKLENVTLESIKTHEETKLLIFRVKIIRKEEETK